MGFGPLYVLWALIGNKIERSRTYNTETDGYVDHGKWKGEQITSYFGRYDPQSKMITVVKPKSGVARFRSLPEEDLVNKLRREFNFRHVQTH